MASLYRRKDSPYWWLADGAKVSSTKLRHDCPQQTRRAYEVLERARAKARMALAEPERWECWVEEHLRRRYETSLKTWGRYRLMWRAVATFLETRKIHYPKQVLYQHCQEYLDWRRAGALSYGVLAAHRNTAIGELKFLSMLMDEAVRRGFASSNPCVRLGLRRQRSEPKPEITEEHLQLMWEKLQAEPEWMRIHFQIGLYTGCRLREARLPLDCVDVERRFIHFPDAKGGKPFTVPMAEELVPVLKRLKAEGFTHAFEMPAMPSKHWWDFFRRIGLPQYCFHCLRVTFISRGCRAGVAEPQMRRLVNHASAEIHRVYQRFQPEDLRRSLAQIGLPRMRAVSGSGDGP